MKIAVAGPYSAETEAGRAANLRRLNEAAARVLEMSHSPVVGVNAALPVLESLDPSADRYEAIMAISMAAISGCDAILMIGESRGANREKAFFTERGLPVYFSIGELPSGERSRR